MSSVKINICSPALLSIYYELKFCDPPPPPNSDVEAPISTAMVFGGSEEGVGGGLRIRMSSSIRRDQTALAPAEAQKRRRRTLEAQPVSSGVATSVAPPPPTRRMVELSGRLGSRLRHLHISLNELFSASELHFLFNKMEELYPCHSMMKTKRDRLQG